MAKKKAAKGMFLGTAEDRWRLSSRMTPEARSIPNEHLIQDMAVTLGMVRGEIVEKLLLYPANLDCIIDDTHRKEMAAWLGTREMTDAERVMYIKDQIGRSSGAGEAWSALLDGKKLVSKADYHRLRYQRLDEQVGKALTQEKNRRNKSTATGNQTGAMKLSMVKDIKIPRAAMGLTGFDLLGGQDEDNFDQVGFCEGDVWLIGGAPGVGKTKVMMHAMAMACGPIVGDTGLYVQSEFDIQTFKARYARGIIKGDEELFISCSTTMGAVIEDIYRHKPRWVVIDSKDKIEECMTTSGWKRFQHRMRQVAKELRCTIFLITHLNGDDKIYGGRKVEHDVDAIALATRVPDVRGAFKIAVPSKNRGGVACEEHFSLWVHNGPKIICTNEPPRWKSKADIVGPATNPLLIEPPMTTVDEQDLQTELDDLLEKISEHGGIEVLSEKERERLAHITDWMTRRDSKPVVARKKELEKAAKMAERAARDAARAKDTSQFTADVEDEDEEDDE